MKKALSILLCVLLLLPCTAAFAADTQSTTLRYSVSARISFVGYDGVRLILQTDVGQTLKEPAHEEIAGYTFIGWVHEETGELWDFSAPVTAHMTLTARYVKNAEPTPAPTASPTGGAGNTPKTGSTTRVPQSTAALALSAAALLVLLKKQKKEQ